MHASAGANLNIQIFKSQSAMHARPQLYRWIPPSCKSRDIGQLSSVCSQIKPTCDTICTIMPTNEPMATMVHTLANNSAVFFNRWDASSH